jgi:flagellar biosynthesis chaperone FliJ
VAQLCGEIVSSRNQRHALNQSLAQETLHRKASVSDMCSDFADLRHGMARATLNERQAFLANLRNAVQTQRSDMQTDLAGVRKAWAGK